MDHAKIAEKNAGPAALAKDPSIIDSPLTVARRDGSTALFVASATLMKSWERCDFFCRREGLGWAVSRAARDTGKYCYWPLYRYHYLAMAFGATGARALLLTAVAVTLDRKLKRMDATTNTAPESRRRESRGNAR